MKKGLITNIISISLAYILGFASTSAKLYNKFGRKCYEGTKEGSEVEGMDLIILILYPQMN